MRDRRLISYARDNRRSMGDAEVLIWTGLRYRGLGVRFRRQHPIGPYIADFACVSMQIVVELDGSQHVDSGYDRVRDEFMKGKGWTVLRFWTWDVSENLNGVLGSIADAIQDRKDLEPPPVDWG